MIEPAVEILRRGGLVAFPTETVYGLGADATNASAVTRIFEAKGRPATNPLIVHVADVDIARRYTIRWTAAADQLAARFWPGPLTIVLVKTDSIVDSVTAGLRSVGLRVPNHPLALELLRAFDGPVAAPSANRANRISPTRAEHVVQELGDAVELVLDGGPCAVGIESTVIDLSNGKPIILRPGGVSRAEIETVLGPVAVFGGSVEKRVAAVSPGQQARHYSPFAPAWRFEKSQREDLINNGRGVMVLIGSGRRDHVEMPNDPKLYARDIYRVLREIDAGHPVAIYIEMPPDSPEWAPVRDRLIRATTLWLSESVL